MTTMAHLTCALSHVTSCISRGALKSPFGSLERTTPRFALNCRQGRSSRTAITATAGGCGSFLQLDLVVVVIVHHLQPRQHRLCDDRNQEGRSSATRPAEKAQRASSAVEMQRKAEKATKPLSRALTQHQDLRPPRDDQHRV